MEKIKSETAYQKARKELERFKARLRSRKNKIVKLQNHAEESIEKNGQKRLSRFILGGKRHGRKT